MVWWEGIGAGLGLVLEGVLMGGSDAGLGWGGSEKEAEAEFVVRGEVPFEGRIIRFSFWGK